MTRRFGLWIGLALALLGAAAGVFAGSAFASVGGAAGGPFAAVSGFFGAQGFTGRGIMGGGAITGYDMMGANAGAGFGMMGGGRTGVYTGRVSRADLARMGDAVPAGAAVDRNQNRVVFTVRNVNLSVVGSPSGQKDETFHLAGVDTA